MQYLASTLAWRYITQKKHNTRMKMMLSICFIGIFIGSFSLCLVLAVLNGFQAATHKTLKNINPEIELHANGQELHVKSIIAVLQKEFPTILAASEYDTQQGLVFTNYEDSPATIVMVKGINPRTEPHVSPITEKIIAPKDMPLRKLLSSQRILIGKGLARELTLTVGDSLDLYFTPANIQSKKISLDHKTLTVGGIFCTGIDEFDNNLIMCSLRTMKGIYLMAGPTHINLQIKESTDIQALKQSLEKRLGLQAVAWQDRYPAIVAALKLEKYAMFLILALITLVASMNIIALLSMHISSKRTDIAILQAMGIPLRLLQRVFIYFGLLLTVSASIFGIACATIASWVIEQYPCITLPDAYYVATLPAKMELHIAAIVFGAVMLVTCLALVIAISMLKTIHITHVLRFEV